MLELTQKVLQSIQSDVDCDVFYHEDTHTLTFSFDPTIRSNMRDLVAYSVLEKLAQYVLESSDFGSVEDLLSQEVEFSSFYSKVLVSPVTFDSLDGSYTSDTYEDERELNEYGDPVDDGYTLPDEGDEYE